MSAGIPHVLDRLRDRYPSVLVDRIDEHETGRRIVAVKNVTVNEEFFQGHYPGAPLLPAVLTIEALAQVATLLVIEHRGGEPVGQVALRGVNRAKFRRQVVPGDRLRLEVTLGDRVGTLLKVQGLASVEGQTVAEAELVLVVQSGGAQVDPTACVQPFGAPWRRYRGRAARRHRSPGRNRTALHGGRSGGHRWPDGAR